VTALPDPEAFTRNSMSSFDRALTHEAQEWLDRVLDLRDQAKAERRAAPSFYKIADQLSDHLAVKVTRPRPPRCSRLSRPIGIASGC
jgi:hypothetical protein